MQQLELEKFEVCKNEKSKLMSLTLEWPSVEGGSTIKQVNIQLYTYVAVHISMVSLRTIQELSTMSMVEVELTSGQRPLQYNVSQPHYSTCVHSMRMCVYTLKCRQRLYHQDHSQTEAFECTSKTHISLCL